MAADYLSGSLGVAEVGPVLEIVEETRKVTGGILNRKRPGAS